MKIIPNINFNSVLQQIPNLEERNIAFDAMDDQSKRQEIAWDCLQLILSGKISGSFREYWSDSLHDIGTLDSKDFQKILNDNLPNCKVCARGGMMLSMIRLGNSINSDCDSKYDGDRSIIKGFDMDSFENMELEYENNHYVHPYEKHTTDKLANICCNVIVNGNFNTEDKTDYLILN